ncbi:MFS transporter [Streptomyces sp. NPDC101151]|uniref:MFS transporter n=1 Tax=Streptomyces sp. NPDC101151 TaxID=3366115 RepID=UPI00381BB2A7
MMAVGESRLPGGRFALAALGLGAFVIGTAELVIVGVLDLIADDLEVSVGAAGLLVTAYALGISVGGPVVTALTIKMGRRRVLWLALAAFIAVNMVALTAVEFGVLLAARALTGVLHGLFLGAAASVATGLVPAERRGHAISLVFGGIAVSTVLGVPLGTWLGQTFGWRATFVGVVVLCALALVATLLCVPEAGGGAPAGLAAQARHAFAPRVLGMLGAGVLLMGAQFTAFTYLAPYVQDVTGVGGGSVGVFLLIFGVTSAIGTFAGGRFADRNASGTLLAGNALLVLALGGLYAFGTHAVLVAVALAGWGLVGMGVTPSLQLRIMSLAGEGEDLAVTLGASAVNAGIAAGAAFGGWVVAAHGLGQVPLAALVIAVVAFPATWATRWLRVPSAPLRGTGTKEAQSAWPRTHTPGR